MTMITDDNDNLIKLGEDGPDLLDSEEEWTTTPGGFCRIEIDLDDEVRKDLINLWARANLNEASLETYDELLKSGGQETALYDAVLNDIILESLRDQLARHEAEQDAES